MATPEDSNVLRQLIDQIEGELSTFNGVSGGSDQSLTSFATSQGSLESSEYEGSLSGSSNGHLPQHQQPLYPQQQQQHSFPTTATSAIFGKTFDRPVPLTQQPHHQPGFGATSLIMNGSYFIGPRAPQYIPSPLASPVSPSCPEKNISSSDLLESGRGSNDSLSTLERSQVKSSQSQGSLSSVAADLLRDDVRDGSVENAVDEFERHTMPEDNEASMNLSLASQEPSQDHRYDDSIKVDVTELYDNFGQKPTLSENDVEERSQYAGGLVVPENVAQGSSTSLKLPELSFSGDDLTSLWAPPTGSLPDTLEVEGAEKRTRLHTFHGHSEASQEKDQLAATSLGSSVTSSLRLSVAFPPKQPSPLKVGYIPSAECKQGISADEEIASVALITDETPENPGIEAGGPSDEHANLKNHVRSDRKRLSLVTSGAGLAAAVAAAGSRTQLAADQEDSINTNSKLGRSVLDLPTWDLAPLSPPVEVKETISASATASPMSARRGSMVQTQQDSLTVDNQHLNGIMSPSSATIMTPTTPLSTREARILAGREALLRMSPDKQRVQRGISASSTSSSIASSIEKPASATNSGDGNDTETSAESLEATRRASIKTQNSQQSQHEGIYGAVPERGQLTDVAPERLIFPDQSIRPVPLKAYKVRKLTLKERNQTYAQACQEFTRARTGLDVWVLRCMMQERPNLMKDPPAIVKAVTGKYTPASTHQNSDTQAKSISASGRMTPTTPHYNSPMASSISGAHGIGAMIKSASKRLSIDASTPQPSIPEITGQGSFFYKQKTTKSAVELGSWSSGRTRGISNNPIAAAGTPPPPQVSSGHRNSITGLEGGMVSSSPIQQQQSSRGGPINSSFSGSAFLPQNKRNSITISSPLSNTLRSRRMSDVQAGSRPSMVGKDSSTSRINSGNSPIPYQQQQRDAASSPAPSSSSGNSGQSSFSPSSYTGAPISTTSSVFMERPIQRSMSYTRRPASMVASSSFNNRPGIANSSTSNASTGSQSSLSLGSVSSNSITESTELKTSSPSSSLTSGLKQQQVQQAQSPRHENSTISPSMSDSRAAQSTFAYNSDGSLIPYADETKSKDEVYSPLTSPIMIPIGGFPVPRPSHNNSYHNNGGWSSPMSAGGGLTRPLTYAGPSSSSNSSLIMSPLSATRESAQPSQQQSQQQQFSQGVTNLERENSASSQEPGKEKSEKSSRYSASSFSSLGSFALYQKRDSQKRASKKERKKELLEQQQQQQQQLQQQQKQQAIDQRYSVSAASVNQSAASANDYMTEQSLDKLSDVLPHVDRDRLSIYLQRAYGDEMVAIGLAMSDFRSGQL
ncbi:hypothetical protein BGX27_009159 [Mortierella sp. AM989]|nr:hypothetical protein BGX27_009159 [Mortierella sp. AM989]